MITNTPSKKFSFRKSASGFSMIEMVIVLLILAIITTFSVMLAMRARSSFSFSNSVTTLQSYLERAISDAKRRNAKADGRAIVRVISTGKYEVRIDADGDGNPENQEINLPRQVKFIFDPAAPPKATIDWRGYIAEGDVSFVLKSESGQISEVKLTSRGDANSTGAFPVLPTVTVTPISTDVETSTILVGNTAPDPNMSPTPTLTPLPVCIGNQRPEPDQCRCKPGKTIDKDGKCK